MRAQGTFEYILLLGGIIIVVLLVIDTLIESAAYSAREVNESINVAYEKIKQALSQIIG